MIRVEEQIVVKVFNEKFSDVPSVVQEVICLSCLELSTEMLRTFKYDGKLE